MTAANAASDRTGPQAAFREAVARARAGLPGAGHHWLDRLREGGRRVFDASGLPTRRVEAWKYSDLARAVEGTPRLAEGDSVEGRAQIAPEHTYAVTFVDGRLESLPAVSALPRGVELIALAEALTVAPQALRDRLGRINPQADHAVLGLNTALMADGLVVRLGRHVVLDRPLHLRFCWPLAGNGSGAGRHVRVLFELEEGAQATLLESHEGAGVTHDLATVVSELSFAASSLLKHVRIERLGGAARHSCVLLADLARAASYEGFYLSEGSAFARHEAFIRLSDEGAEAQVDGATLVSGERHVDNTTVLDHAGSRARSAQLFKSVLTGRGRSIYQGRVIVRKDAQHTDAQQLSKALLLSHGVEAMTKPELEILADDVKCSHGATTGELDANALFYLRARGVSEGEARGLLVRAFITGALEEIHDPALRAIAEVTVEDWLARHAAEVSHAG